MRSLDFQSLSELFYMIFAFSIFILTYNFLLLFPIDLSYLAYILYEGIQFFQKAKLLSDI